jgi:hypothetical protein
MSEADSNFQSWFEENISSSSTEIPKENFFPKNY